VGIENFYKKWILQELEEIEPNSGDWELRDGCEILGIFRQNSSNEALTAATPEANTRGRFVCHTKEKVDFGAVLRCGGLFIRLEGEATVAPKSATVQIKAFPAIITSKVT